MEEYRIRLQDDSVNFMNLASPVEFKFLNFADKMTEVYGLNSSPLSVEIFLSRKVFI